MYRLVLKSTLLNCMCICYNTKSQSELYLEDCVTAQNDNNNEAE